MVNRGTSSNNQAIEDDESLSNDNDGCSSPLANKSKRARVSTPAAAVIGRPVGLKVTPRTRAAQFFTPGNMAPQALSLFVILGPGQDLEIPVRVGTSLAEVIAHIEGELKLRKIDDSWPKLLGLHDAAEPWSQWDERSWERIVRMGGKARAGLVWDGVM